MIICDSKQYLEELSVEVGVSCVDFDLITFLESLMTIDQVMQLITAQWVVYGVILAFAWSKYAIQRYAKL